MQNLDSDICIYKLNALTLQIKNDSKNFEF